MMQIALAKNFRVLDETKTKRSTAALKRGARTNLQHPLATSAISDGGGCSGANDVPDSLGD